jgi:hypothetical protein
MRGVAIAAAAALLLGVARGQQHWAYRPLVRAVAPGPAGEIDAFVAARLAEAGLSPSPEADAATLVRRLYLVLHGLPPTPAEFDAGVAEVAAGGYAHLVDRLLASPRYGEAWARHWLDLARYADTHGFETNTPRAHAWRYRDWVIAALNDDLPYDDFVRAQLAGDALGQDAATGFLVAGPWDEVKSPDPRLTAEQRSNELADMVGVVGMAFFGTTLGCARCHDHKFDPVSQADFYAVEAVFAGVRHGDRPVRAADGPARSAAASALADEIAALDLELAAAEPLADPHSDAPGRPAVHPRRNVERFAPVRAEAVRISIDEVLGGIEPCIDELRVFVAGGAHNVAAASSGATVEASSVYPDSAIHRVPHAIDGEEGNARSWIPSEPGGGWLEVRFAVPVVVDRVEWARDRTGRFADRLALRYRIELRTEDGWTTVATAADRRPYVPGAPLSEEPQRIAAFARRDQLALRRAALADAPLAYAGRFEEPGPTHRLHRGDPMSPREVVAPGGVAAFGALRLPADTPEQQRRLALADWIVRTAHPLTARVIVNRIWQQHFGTGLAATPSDFGRNGAAPSHPELLDALAADLVADGWSLKRLHRRIVNSATWRQAAAPRSRELAVDPDGRLLWRFPPRRLDAEVIRDAILQASGELDPSAGGPGFDVFEPNDNYVRVYEPKREFGTDTLRRMVYARRVRMERDPTFGVFDCPDGGQSEPRRGRSTTALQALALRNSPFVAQRAVAMAAALRQQVGDGVEAQVVAAFRRVYQRGPAPAELAAAAELVADHGLEELCRALFNTNEFLFLP